MSGAPEQRSAARLLTQRMETDPDSVERDLFKLVLTVIELIRQLMEAQALRRVDEGDLSDEQVEALGLGLHHVGDGARDPAVHHLAVTFARTTR